MSTTTLVATIGSAAYLVDRGSFSWQDRLGSRSTGSLTITMPVNSPGPAHGQPITVTFSGTTVFVGRINRPTRRLDGPTRVRYTCSMVERSEAFDRRLVAKTYESKTLAYIVNDINTNFLDGEGFTVTGVETGPTLTVSFNYKPVTECFNELSRLSGYAYWLDWSNDIQFKSRTSVSASTTLDAVNAYNYSVEEDAETFRNAQYVRGGLDLTEDLTEKFNGDGKRRTFNTAYPIGAVPTSIKVATVAKTVGIRGVDPAGSKQWYWNLGVNEITQDDTETIVADGTEVEIVYKGQFPILVFGTDDASITERATIESSSGRHEVIDQDASIRSSAVAIDKVQALLSRYGMVADKVTCTTQEGGFRVGQLVTIDNELLALNGQYLIESINARMASPDRIEYTITSVGGNSYGTWQEFFLALVQSTRDNDPIANEVLHLIRTQFDDVQCGDSTLVSTSSPETRIDFATIGFGEIG